MTAPDGRYTQGIEAVANGLLHFLRTFESIRSAYQLLTHIGYNATYTELPDWGHAYTYSINEQLVVPWMESL